jgi:DNA-binding CsgD family transcriptional regulator
MAAVSVQVSWPFRSTTALSNWIKVLSGAIILGVLIVFFTYFNFTGTITTYMKNPPRTFFEANMAQSRIYGLATTFDNTYALFNVFYLLASVVVQILLLIWVYRSARNLLTLGIQGIRYSPGWAVGWFFIPFANLIMPPLVLTEIWKASGPAAGSDDWRRGSLNLFIPLWWLCMLGITASIFLLPYFLRNAPDPAATGDFSAMTTRLTVIGLLQIGWAVGLIGSVAGITSRQYLKNEIHLSGGTARFPFFAKGDPATDEATLSPAIGPLSEIEFSVMILLSQGYVEDEIAKQLSMTNTQARQIIDSLYSKFEVNRVDDLVWEARKRGHLPKNL